MIWSPTDNTIGHLIILPLATSLLAQFAKKSNAIGSTKLSGRENHSYKSQALSVACRSCQHHTEYRLISRPGLLSTPTHAIPIHKMSTNQKNIAPPAYEQLPNSEATSHIFLDRIQNTVTAEYNNVDNDSTETKRLRNFLLYCLAVDYRAPISLTISESDREHFREMSATLWDLQNIDSDQLVHLDTVDRQAFAPYFWKYLHGPCTGLGIPVESAVHIVLRYSKFLTLSGLYKGCVHGLMHNYEPSHLARKLLLDRSVLIPHLVRPGATRSKLVDSLHEVASFYFTSIKGERSSIVEGTDPTVGFQEDVLMDYTMTERGRCYAANRDKTCHAAKGWVGPILGAVRERLVGLARTYHEIFPKSSKQGLCDNDTCVCPAPASGLRSWHDSLWNHPPRSRDLLSVDLPDLFEWRSCQGRCDV